MKSVSAMDRSKLNLVHFASRRERELLDLVRDTEFDRILRGEVNLAEPASGQEFIGDRTPIAQDAFRAILLRQGRVH